MRKIYLPIIVFIGLFIFFLSPGQDRPETSEVDSLEFTSKKIQAQEAPQRTIPVSKPALITPKELNDLRRSYPHTEDVKLEVTENPHVTPPSMIKFAEKLGLLVDKGMKSPGDAKILVNELKECVSDNSVMVSSRTVCLNKAEELSRTYPQLNSDVLRIRESADEDVIKLSRKMNSYIKNDKGTL